MLNVKIGVRFSMDTLGTMLSYCAGYVQDLKREAGRRHVCIHTVELIHICVTDFSQ